MCSWEKYPWLLAPATKTTFLSAAPRAVNRKARQNEKRKEEGLIIMRTFVGLRKISRFTEAGYASIIKRYATAFFYSRLNVLTPNFRGTDK